MNKFELADLILESLYLSPETGCSVKDVSEKFGKTEKEANDAFAVLRSQKYVELTPLREIYINNDGCYFHLSGGFREQLRREKLMTDNIEASNRSYEISEKVSKRSLWVAYASLAVAVITLLAFLYQVFCLR